MTVYDVYRVSRDGEGVCVVQGLQMRENAETVAREWNAYDIKEGRRSGVGQEHAYEVVERTVGDAA